MGHSIDRRTILMVAGATAAAMTTRSVAAQSTDIRGVLRFDGNEIIPEGQIEVYFEDSAIQDVSQLRAARTHVVSDGKSKSIDFTLSLPTSTMGSSTQEIVARLERLDGWLLARGSAKLKAGTPAHVTLHAAIY